MGKQWEKNNYCTFGPDILFGVNMKKFCYEHDLDYSKQRDISRLNADRKLRDSIYKEFKSKNKKIKGYFVSRTYFLLSRIFGIFYWKTW